MVSPRVHVIVVLLTCVLYLKSVTGGVKTRQEISDSYHKKRVAFISAELENMVGGNVKLTEEESVVNNRLMQAKYKEVDESFDDESKFNPSHLFTERKDKIQESKVFKFIRKMPKGAALHIHDTALIGQDYLVKNITYRDNLYLCYFNKTIKMIFSDGVPKNDKCNWHLLKDLRKDAKHTSAIDKFIEEHITLEFMDPALRKNNYVMWEYFMKIFRIITPLITYKPVFQDYFYEALRQYREDNVSYLEIRTTLPPLYELNGTMLDPVETAKTYKAVNDKFVKDHPDMIGSKIIYAPARFVNVDGIQVYIDRLFKVRKAVGDYLAGFDLVGQEDTGKPLLEYIENLLPLVGNINVFYHAGETNWFGTWTDFNLYDAVLLRTKRIGHGYALLKHPIIAKIVKNRGIAVEVNPISNQMLMLVEDMRNHPAAIMLAENMPMVISSDDPGLWGALPLSHDFYELFVGIASRHSDIGLLKQLAMNSIKYSAMNTTQSEFAMNKFNDNWQAFIRSFINSTNERVEQL